MDFQKKFDSLQLSNHRTFKAFVVIVMKTVCLLFFLVTTQCLQGAFAQAAANDTARAQNPLPLMTVIKVDEVSRKEDIDQVKKSLAVFGYGIHSFKVNFERREVLIRMRKPIESEAIVAALKSNGYSAWYDPDAKVFLQDAIVRQ